MSPQSRLYRIFGIYDVYGALYSFLFGPTTLSTPTPQGIAFFFVGGVWLKGGRHGAWCGLHPLFNDCCAVVQPVFECYRSCICSFGCFWLQVWRRLHRRASWPTRSSTKEQGPSCHCWIIINAGGEAIKLPVFCPKHFSRFILWLALAQYAHAFYEAEKN